ncbi:hypothetical protein GWI33_023346, partial [Rhynchophorus ferrugineus]
DGFGTASVRNFPQLLPDAVKTTDSHKRISGKLEKPPGENLNPKVKATRDLWCCFQNTTATVA